MNLLRCTRSQNRKAIIRMIGSYGYRPKTTETPSPYSVAALISVIAPLTQALTLAPTDYRVLLNRAIAYLRAGKLNAAQQDYEVLRKVFPKDFKIYYGLGEVARQKNDTNDAILNYALYLANAPTNTAEANEVSARLRELKPGSP